MYKPGENVNVIQLVSYHQTLYNG